MDTVVTGLKNAGLVFSGPGVWSAMRDAVPKLVEHEMHFQEPMPLSAAAQSYKERIMAMFLPTESHIQKRVTVLGLCRMLNTDWRQRELAHACSGCCASRQDAQQKLVVYLQKVLTALRPGVMNLANWKEWRACLPIYALGMAMHCWLPKLFFLVFSEHPNPGPQRGGGRKVSKLQTQSQQRCHLMT